MLPYHTTADKTVKVNKFVFGHFMLVLSGSRWLDTPLDASLVYLPSTDRQVCVSLKNSELFIVTKFTHYFSGVIFSSAWLCEQS